MRLVPCAKYGSRHRHVDCLSITNVNYTTPHRALYVVCNSVLSLGGARYSTQWYALQFHVSHALHCQLPDNYSLHYITLKFKVKKCLALQSLYNSIRHLLLTTLTITSDLLLLLLTYHFITVADVQWILRFLLQLYCAYFVFFLFLCFCNPAVGCNIVNKVEFEVKTYGIVSL